MTDQVNEALDYTPGELDRTAPERICEKAKTPSPKATGLFVGGFGVDSGASQGVARGVDMGPAGGGDGGAGVGDAFGAEQGAELAAARE